MSGYITITDAAKMVGITQGTIYSWVSRYGWPAVHRHQSGCIAGLTEDQVKQLHRVAAAVRTGIPIRKILASGSPQLPELSSDEEAEYQKAIGALLDCLNQPHHVWWSAEGKAAREHAIRLVQRMRVKRAVQHA